MGELVLHVGPQGHGSLVKLVNNTLAAINAAALAEALVFARAEGLDPDALREVVAAGSGASRMLDLKAEPMLAGRLRAALQARAHAQGCAPLPRRGRADRRIGASSDRWPSGSTPRPTVRGLGGRDFAAVIEAANDGSP